MLRKINRTAAKSALIETALYFKDYIIFYFYSSAESGNCYGCFFRNISGGIDNCIDHNEKIKIIFTKTIPKFKPIPINSEGYVISDENLIYMGIGVALVLVSVIMVLAAIIHKKKDHIKGKLGKVSNQSSLSRSTLYVEY